MRRGQNGCPVTIPRAYKAPILVWNVNLLESNKNVRAISRYHQSWKQAACKAKKLRTILTKHAGHPHKSHKTEHLHTDTRTHTHTHTPHTQDESLFAVLFQQVWSSWILFSWVPPAILQMRIAQFSMTRHPELQFWSFRLRKMMCLTDFAKG